MSKKPGYHLTDITRGVIGDSSKIAEEVAELIDAEQQDCKIMALVELSDLYGAMDAYLAKNFPDIKMSDIQTMSKITVRAFLNGHR
jgi:hypothetical protein